MDSRSSNGIVMCQIGCVACQSLEKEEPIMKISRIGLDLAKNVFQIHGVDEHEKPVIQRELQRGKGKRGRRD